MIKMQPYIPSSRLAVRDSSIDDDLSDDIDDDVFIKDSRSAKLNEEKGLKRPLMAPRRKHGKSQNSVPIMKRHRRCWRCCEPFCYGLAALVVLIALISLAGLILSMFPLPLQKVKVWLKPNGRNDPHNINTNSLLDEKKVLSGNSLGSEFVPCTQISVQKIWTKTFGRMNSESPVRKVDLNGDDIQDIVFGFGVDDNIQYEGLTLPKCKSPQQGDEVPCEGGVIALNGRNGELLWQTWNVANVFSLLCSMDIDKDGYPDCIAAGRLGMIFAINGRNGNTIWEFKEIEIETNSPIVMDLYTINLIRDLDGDEVNDILAAHLEEREESKAGHIKIISGKNGKVIRSVPTPLREEVFVPLQVITREDGTEVLVVITGGQNTPGGIYSIRLLSLMKYTSEKQYTPLYKRPHSGFMVPAIFTDLNGDRIPDIVVSSFNATVYAFDGKNYTNLWNFTFPASESVSAIVPGHFNEDNVTDFLVKYNAGPGFPVYYYSQTTILDGKTGRPLLSAMMTDSGGSNSLLGGVSVSQTFGGDFFLHWQMQCRDKYDAKDAYEFVPDTDIIMQARADTCRLRYNASTVLKLYAIARHIQPPGAVIFSTDDLEVHLNKTQHVQIQREHPKSPIKHPKLLKKLLADRENFLKKISLTNQMKHLEMPHRKKPIIDEELLEALPNIEQFEGPKLNTYPFLEEGPLIGSPQLKPFQKDYDGDNVGSSLNGEYEMLYNDNEIPEQVPPQVNEHPIRLRTKYPGTRDVRSESSRIETETNQTSPSLPKESQTTKNKTKKKDQPYSLWDLELEKEEQDVINQVSKYGLEYKEKKAKQKSRRYASENKTGEAVKSVDSIHDSDDWFLASISSTGVLLKSLNGTVSSIDFAFVLNIRESETFPPLFLPQDLNCVEEKLSAYKTYTVDNRRVLKKQFIKQCLKDRLVDLTPVVPQYESQIIVTRIGITCSCRPLKNGEVCSELDGIHTQRWTEYMGNDGHGYYAN